MIITNGNVFCEDGAFRTQNVYLKDRLIVDKQSAASEDHCYDAGGNYVVPGFIDIHIHGAVKADFSDADADSLHTMASFLLKKGVTSFLGTSMALPYDTLKAVFSTARPLINAETENEATLRGINMEGPFLSMEKRGAQNAKNIIPPDIDIFTQLFKASGESIKLVDIAPEFSSSMDFIKYASEFCHVSIAHTCSDYDTAFNAYQCGADHATHLFNGMPPYEHRSPGVIGAAFDAGAYVEMICDGAHIHPSVIRGMFKMFGDDRICLISDAMRACGMPDGTYDLGGLEVKVEHPRATIASGSLAGSTTCLADCVRKACSFGVPLESAIKAATMTPAKSVGLFDHIGSISVGKIADILILDKELRLLDVIKGGQLLSR